MNLFFKVYGVYAFIGLAIGVLKLWGNRHLYGKDHPTYTFLAWSTLILGLMNNWLFHLLMAYHSKNRQTITGDR